MNYKSVYVVCFKLKGFKNNCVGLLELYFSFFLVFVDFVVEEWLEMIFRKDENKLFFKCFIRSIFKKKYVIKSWKVNGG